MDIEEQKKRENDFLGVAERFRAATDPREVERLGDMMGCFIFG